MPPSVTSAVPRSKLLITRLPLSFDRMTGAVKHTLGDLAGGSTLETFHFALNNTVISDNRIPPYGMSYDEAERRNASPVPQGQYEGEPGGVYEFYDELDLTPPGGARTATLDLLYQPTSWEYIQFLALGNKGTDPAVGGNAFLGEEGQNILDAWLHTGMAEPFVMATATLGTCDGVGGCEVLLCDARIGVIEAMQKEKV